MVQCVMTFVASQVSEQQIYISVHDIIIMKMLIISEVGQRNLRMVSHLWPCAEATVCPKDVKVGLKLFFNPFLKATSSK